MVPLDGNIPAILVYECDGNPYPDRSETSEKIISKIIKIKCKLQHRNNPDKIITLITVWIKIFSLGY
jgi:hypothetical protein